MLISDLYRLFKKCEVVTTDSRNIPNGSIFFALKGGKFNGNLYAKEALEKGSSYAVVDEYIDDDPRLILVDNVLKTFQDLAAYHRKTLNIPVIGITGTNGKTTTKELVSSVLAKKYNVLYTIGNLNNHIGVPTTLLKINDSHGIAVVEMGANYVGEIAELCEMVRPTHGIITNIGKAHLEGFGSFEGVLKTKLGLYDSLRRDSGIAIQNPNNNYLVTNCNNINTILYEEVTTTDTNLPFLTAVFDGINIKTNFIGDYNAENIAAAVTAGKIFGVYKDDIVKAIEDYKPSNNRSQWLETSTNKLIIDAYNANPTSMNAAISNFAALQLANKMLILGDMRELGNVAEDEHKAIVDLIKNNNFEKVILIGDEFTKAATPNMITFKTRVEFEEWLKNNKLSNYTILIKGSNSIGLEALKNVL